MNTVVRQPHDISFAGNPVVFEIMSDIYGEKRFKVQIKHFVNEVTIEEVNLFFSSYAIKKGALYHAEIDFSDILEAYCTPLFKRKYITGGWTNGAVKYSISMPDDPGIIIPEKTIIPGGVSDAVFINFLSAGTDIFTTRFANPASLFLFSNRSSNKVNIKYFESELCDAWFIRLPGKVYKLVTADNAEYLIPNTSGETNQYFDTVDLVAAYAQLSPADGMLYMHVDGEPVFYINILPDPPSEEKYLLEFRNSFGFLERILLTGKLKYEPEFQDGEEFSVNENHIIRRQNRRKTFNQKYKGDIGYKRMEDILFLQDLLLSDEVRIFNPISEEYMECSVSAEISLSILQTEPESIPIEIRVLNSEKYISVDYNYRIFDFTFDDTFN